MLECRASAYKLSSRARFALSETQQEKLRATLRKEIARGEPNCNGGQLSASQQLTQPRRASQASGSSFLLSSGFAGVRVHVSCAQLVILPLLYQAKGACSTMPPRQSLTSSFSVTDVNNEVVCPLRNQVRTDRDTNCLLARKARLTHIPGRIPLPQAMSRGESSFLYLLHSTHVIPNGTPQMHVQG